MNCIYIWSIIPKVEGFTGPKTVGKVRLKSKSEICKIDVLEERQEVYEV